MFGVGHKDRHQILHFGQADRLFEVALRPAGLRQVADAQSRVQADELLPILCLENGVQLRFVQKRI